MKTPNWAPVNLGKVDGFDITLHFEREDINPVQLLEGTELNYEYLKNHYYFSATVIASAGNSCGFEGHAYLAACIYANKKEALGDDPLNTALGGYMPQLISEAITQSRARMEKTLNSLPVQIISGHLAWLEKQHASATGLNNSYIIAQFARIATPTNCEKAAMLKVKGANGGETNWLDISAEVLEAIKNLLKKSKGAN